MGTTPNKGLRYPESSDFVKDGAAAMQQLAEDVDEALGGAYFFGLLSPAPQSIPHNAETIAATGLDIRSGTEWSFAGGVITYTGPDSIAVLTGYGLWVANAAGFRRLTLLQNGSGIAASRDTPDDAAATEQSVAQLVKLTSGDTFALRVRQTSGGALNLNDAKLRAVVVAGV